MLKVPNVASASVILATERAIVRASPSVAVVALRQAVDRAGYAASEVDDAQPGLTVLIAAVPGELAAIAFDEGRYVEAAEHARECGEAMARLQSHQWPATSSRSLPRPAP